MIAARSLAVLLLLGAAGAAIADPAPLHRDALVAHHEAMFDRVDTNHDGWLSKAEYLAALNAIDARRDVTPTAKGWARVEDQWNMVDQAHAGRVSRAQFVAAAIAHFDGADLNHDGIVTPDEARKAAKIKQKALDAAARMGAEPN